MRRPDVLLLTLLLAAAASAPLSAQDTRDDARAKAQAEKAARLQPYTPSIWERRIAAAGRIFTEPSNVYVFFGSFFRGSSLGVGPGYRTRFGESGAFDAHAAWSLRNFRFVGTSVQLPAVADGRLQLTAHADWTDAPRLEFYGLGPDAPDTARTTFGMEQRTAGAVLRAQAAPGLTVGAGVDALDFTTGGGSKAPSIGERFGPADAPGLGSSPLFARTQLYAEYDWRTAPGYSTSGGRYRVDWYRYDDRDGGTFDFDRVDVELHQFVPILRANWIIALRALASFTATDDDGRVPYYLMPSLGGSRELRGYPSWRFRDRHRLLLTGEYRWAAGRYVDMALFMDAGKVAPRREDLTLADLDRTYGIGVRFHTPTVSVLRFDLARSADGFRLAINARPSF